MEKSFLEILEQTINYLRFQRDYGNLNLYDEKIKLSKNLYDKEHENMQYEFKSEKGLDKVIAVKEELNSMLFLTLCECLRLIEFLFGAPGSVSQAGLPFWR